MKTRPNNNKKTAKKSSNARLLLLALVVAIAVPVARFVLNAQQALSLLGTGALLESVDRYHQDVFRHTRVLVIAYSEQGAMGVVINTPLQQALTRYTPAPPLSDFASYPLSQVQWGGPVDLLTPYALLLDPGGRSFTMVASKESPSVVYFGYAGWSAGQLESEIARGRWRVTKPDAGTLIRLLNLSQQNEQVPTS